MDNCEYCWLAFFIPDGNKSLSLAWANEWETGMLFCGVLETSVQGTVTYGTHLY